VTETYRPDDHLGHRSLLVAAAYVLLRRDDEVLLQLRQNTGYRDGWWACLAGHVEPAESVHEAAVREAREEGGIDVAVEDLEPVTVLHRFERGGPQVEQRMDAFFQVRSWRGEPTVMEPDKCADMRWFSLDDLPLVVPHELVVLEMLRAGGPAPAIVSLPAD
jgi:8-oxo-dGTP diphosphatase